MRFGSKAPEHVTRIAGVLAVFEDPSLAVDQVKMIKFEYVERAVEIVEYFLEERLRFHNYYSIDPKLMTTQNVLDWAKSKGKTGVLLRELYQYGPSEVRSKDKALSILNILEGHGLAFPVPAHEITSGARGKAWRFIWPNED